VDRCLPDRRHRPRGRHSFDHGGNAYAIYRSPDDAYYTTDGHCTHEQTLLCDGLVMGGIIECPKHNGRFDYTSGKALGAPVLVDVRTYPTKVMNGTVYIEVGDQLADDR
jgi:3-phenylpropionate/trans-cinnamate dioxygenase ferredoxin component